MTLYCRERVRRVVGGVPAVLHNRQLEVLGCDQKFSHIDRPCMGDGWGNFRAEQVVGNEVRCKFYDHRTLLISYKLNGENGWPQKEARPLTAAAPSLWSRYKAFGRRRGSLTLDWHPGFPTGVGLG
jgi:hypothetical protein